MVIASILDSWNPASLSLRGVDGAQPWFCLTLDLRAFWYCHFSPINSGFSYRISLRLSYSSRISYILFIFLSTLNQLVNEVSNFINHFDLFFVSQVRIVSQQILMFSTEVFLTMRPEFSVRLSFIVQNSTVDQVWSWGFQWLLAFFPTAKLGCSNIVYLLWFNTWRYA